MVGAARDLLVDREADADRRVLELGMAFEVGDRGHDLGHAGLVVGAEQRRAVAVTMSWPTFFWSSGSSSGSSTTPSWGSSIVPPSYASCTSGLTPVPVTSGEVSTCAI